MAFFGRQKPAMATPLTKADYAVRMPWVTRMPAPDWRYKVSGPLRIFGPRRRYVEPGRSKSKARFAVYLAADRKGFDLHNQLFFRRWSTATWLEQSSESCLYNLELRVNRQKGNPVPGTRLAAEDKGSTVHNAF